MDVAHVSLTGWIYYVLTISFVLLVLLRGYWIFKRLNILQILNFHTWREKSGASFQCAPPVDVTQALKIKKDKNQKLQTIYVAW